MSEDYKGQLKRLLRNLFQFDYADLDFGIYRIMNKKRDEIERFIEEDLIDAVDAEFGAYAESRGESLKEEVESIKSEIREKLGADAFDESDKIKPLYVTTPFARELAERYEEMRAAMKESDMSDQHEGEIFSHIHQFFSRYYDNGDFMSLRRYSQKEKYAIPYNGEEVVLHWANKDQYYIKTGENFKNYSFKIGEYTVEFLVREAEGTTNNNKAEKRFFVLASSRDNLDYDDSNKTLTIFFEYRGLSKDEEKDYGKKNVQEVILAKIKDEITSQVEDSGLKAGLTKVVSTSKDIKRSLIEKHLRVYTKKNTTDYFIHKNLKEFLTRELDFYIKNEVFHLDDLGTENETNVAQYVTRAKVMKNISLKIIDFLAQIEDFQKMLFEKKKFVVKTDYCMTLDNVPEELYPEILGNGAQLDEWNVLYGIGEEKQQTITSFGSEGIDEAYLKEHPCLVLDTKFFDREFNDRLIASFNDIDETVGGLMIKSENWQALNLMQKKYNEKVKCIYIDPPYNTGNDEFIYKDNYQHSSWLSMMANSLTMSHYLLEKEGVIFVSIDDNEVANLRSLMNMVYGDECFASTLAIINNFSGRSDRKNIATSHEHMLMFSRNNFESKGLPLSEKQKREYKERDNKGYYRLQGLRKRGASSKREDRPNLFYPFYYSPTSDTLSLQESKDHIKILPKLSDGSEGNWRWGQQRVLKNIDNLLVKKVSKRDEYDIYEKVYLEQEGEIKRTKAKSIWMDSRYSSDFATTAYKKIMGGVQFKNPKSHELIKDIVDLASHDDDIILDFFAGSATTAHSVLALNKEDGGHRNYIMIEMGEYFDAIIKPRVKKLMFCFEWDEAIPQSTNGISHIFKYQSLEQYEDTLNNIEFREAGTVQRTLADMDGYFLRYMLDFETRGSSPCRFNVDKLAKPFDYTLRITEGVELKEETVDVVETFNYLLGIHVKQIKTFSNNGTYYRVVLGRKDEDDIAIIWRDTENIDLVADKEFIEGTILNGIVPSKTFINSDFFVEGAHPIEPEFKKLMVV